MYPSIVDFSESTELVCTLIVDVYMVLTNHVKVFSVFLNSAYSIEKEDIFRYKASCLSIWYLSQTELPAFTFNHVAHLGCCMSL